MSNKKELYNIFVEILDVSADQITEDLTYNSIPQWNSIAHMALIAAIEQKFDLMLDTDDVIGMSSVKKALDILIKNGIKISR